MVWSRGSVNYFTTTFLFFVLGNGLTHVTSEIHELSGPRVTTWRQWGKWHYCPDDTYVIGFRLKTERRQGGADDTALNGISFRCGSPNNSTIWDITSSIGKWGRWGRAFDCENGMYAVGFQLLVEPPQGKKDDTAANNLRVLCANWESPSKRSLLEGDGLDWGSWTDLKVCPVGMVMCGIQTRVEEIPLFPFRGFLWHIDETGLNDLDALCCS